MSDTNTTADKEKLQAWVKEQTEAATYRLMDQGQYKSVSIESKAVWVLPYALVIGKIREGGQDRAFDWFITGDAPLCRLSSGSAATPREAARHFALQWQMDAARMGAEGDKLVKQAEALYELSENDAFWNSQDDSLAK